MGKTREVKWKRVSELLEKDSFFQKHPLLEVRKQFSFQSQTELLVKFSFFNNNEILKLNDKDTIDFTLPIEEDISIEERVVIDLINFLKTVL